MTKIDVRSFTSEDFSVFADAYDKTWGYEISDDPADRVRELSGPFYLAGNLLKSDWVRVATVDGKPAGLLCASFDAQCARRGVRAAYLFTDTHCAWQAYLRYGWQKMVESPKNRYGLEQLALIKIYSPV